MVIVPLLERHWGSHKRGSVAPNQVQWNILQPKTQMRALRLVHTPLISPPSLYISIMTVTSSNDATIICFPHQVGKTLHMHSRVAPTHVHIHQCPCLSSLTATHELSHQFCILVSKPVTLSPRYFGAPLYQILKFIKTICENMYKNNRWLNEVKWHGTQSAIKWVHTKHYTESNRTITVADRCIKKD